jgi:TetR/AcrR family transcriptional regulator, transcriptional repressor of bet genes
MFCITAVMLPRSVPYRRCVPRVVDHTQRRTDLALAACTVIARAGVDGTTMRAVAAEAGCTTGMVRHYYADRQELVVAALDASTAAAGARILQRERESPADLRGALTESLPLDTRRQEEWRVWTAFWGAAVGDPRLGDEHRRRYDAWREVLVRLLRRRGIGDAPEVAESLMVGVDGIGVHAVLDPQGWPAERQLAHLDRVLEAALTPVRPGPAGPAVVTP